MKRHILATLALLLPLSARLPALEAARPPADPSFVENYVSRVWTTEDGLPGMTVNDVIQDKRGYIYAATYDGLARFDGVEFTIFSRAYSDRFDFASAHALLLDSRGNIWVGHNDEGVSCFTTDGRIVKFSKDNGLVHNKVNALCEDRLGNVWVGTAVGIGRITPQMVADVPYFLQRECARLVVSSLSCDSSGRIWVATGHGDDLYTINPEQTSISRYSGPGLVGESVSAVCEDGDGALWFCTTKNLAVRVKDGEETVFDVSHDHKTNTLIHYVMQDSQGNHWFATEAGLTVLHDGKISYLDKRNGLNDDSVSDILEDMEGNIWAALNRGGLQKLTLSKFHTVGMNVTVNAICTDEARGAVWLGTDDGVYCRSGGKFVENELTRLTKGTRIRHVAMADGGELLAAGFSFDFPHISLLADGTLRTRSVADGIAGFKGRVSIKTRAGDYYVGTATGLTVLRADGSVRSMTKADGFVNDYIMWLHEDDDGRVWVGTNGGGIYVLRDEAIVRHYTTEDGLAGNVIFKIAPQDGALWVGTGTGLSRYDAGTDSFRSINSKNGLGTDSVFQLLVDSNGTAWMTTNKGVLSVPMKELDAVISGRKDRFAVQVYGKSEGLSTSGVTSTSRSHRDRQGRIYFTLVDGFAVYDPSSLAKNQFPPKVEVQSYSIDGETFEYRGQKIEIPPSARRLSIKYTGLSFVAPEKVRFSWRLAGFDPDFSEWDGQRLASFTNLKPGEYEFSVIAQNNDGVQSEPSAPLRIAKLPHVWQTAWFWAAAFLLVALTLSLSVHAKFHSMQMKARREKEFTGAIIDAFANCIDGKDEYTNGHAHRVAKYTKMLAEALGERRETVEDFYNIALLHDIGKIAVPDEILKKPAKLTDEEFAVMKSHAQKGYEILKDVKIQEDLAQGAHHHHERFDGRGYPSGLSGGQIPWVARIIAVADTFDAMSSTRPYRKKLPLDFIVEEIRRCSGTQFDPKVVDAFLLLNAMGRFEDLR